MIKEGRFQEKNDVPGCRLWRWPRHTPHGKHGGAEGKVTGTDADEQIIALAQEGADAAKLDNVEFRQGDACTCQWHEEYDLAYARFLLSHLSEPERCLAAMVRACRPRGAIVVEDIDFSGSFCYPHCAAYERYVEVYQKVVQR
ncbi:MAG: class I SAM-dependent methyltransferase [Verrucomicrobia bacterium]|nr:MAG: class I SAM-dependent methyltransferase [Verrucomicrobiota bacterium]